MPLLIDGNLINVAGLAVNGMGVLLLANEVRHGQVTERMFMTTRKAMRHLKALHDDPVGQAKRDLEEVKDKLDSMPLDERFQWKATEAAIASGQLDLVVSEMKEHYSGLLEAAENKADLLDEHLSPVALARRRKLLRLGVTCIILGMVLQGVSTYL